MRSQISLLLAASYLAGAVPLPFLDRRHVSQRWIQDTAPVSLIHRAAPSANASVTFINPSGSPVATVAASQLDSPSSAQSSSAAPTSSAVTSNGTSTMMSSDSASVAPSGMVGIVPAVGNNAGSPPLTSFPVVAMPGTSLATATHTSTSAAQNVASALPSSNSTAASQGGMVGIVPAVPNNPGSSPPLTTFPAVAAANPKISSTSAHSNGTSSKATAPGTASVLFTTIMVTITTTRSRSSTSRTTSTANSTSIATTPAPTPAQATTSGSSGDTFPLISSNPPATPAPEPTSSIDSMKTTFALGSTTTPPPAPASPTPSSAGTLLTFSLKGSASSSTMLVLPSILTVSPSTPPQTTLTIAPPNASTLPASISPSLSNPTTSPAGLQIIPLNTSGPSSTASVTDAGIASSSGGTVTVTQTVAQITKTQTLVQAASTVTVTV